jgi:hypothetical protein
VTHRIAGTLLLAALLLCLPTVAAAQGDHWCTNARVAGDWGYTKTGTLYHPANGPIPFATMGKLTLHPDGSLSGVNTGSVGGAVSQDVLSGTFAVNADCTGTTTVGVYDRSGRLLRTIVMALVVDDGARQLRGLMTSLTLPNGLVLPTVITAEARKMFPARDNEQ